MKRHLLSVMCSRVSCYHVARSNNLRVRVYCSQPTQKPISKTPYETTSATQLKWVELSKDLSKKAVEHIRITTNSMWEKYEEFVGLKEVQEAQFKVTEAEKAFMVARGVVRQSRETLENQQSKLKEVRDRLDRVSREDNRYLELATQEHKLLQEERRHRIAHENAEELERETFAHFSAAVRESHEKERTRAERTKNWSVIGSVLGAMIGVLGSTYINRVRLQELKGLLLEAQKGPINLQEALKEQASVHQTQSQELSTLVTSLKELVHDESAFQQADVARPAELFQQFRFSFLISSICNYFQFLYILKTCLALRPIAALMVENSQLSTNQESMGTLDQDWHNHQVVTWRNKIWVAQKQ
ncbi:mitochondrial potassium channel isoform X2 [Chiloscyllium plagiosum]|uniref:mitochondrial potassium channel isoform X2 n=1 Tax=Chiloscyllium plagiosum TaxID=36176 RepID=UPI001CB7E52F|nr:mitochondrial potassium channel isoform X2 [Chiloscyllium plagiosum]